MFIFIANGQMQHPFGKIYNSAGTVYEGKIEFRQEISGQKAVTCAGSIWHRNTLPRYYPVCTYLLRRVRGWEGCFYQDACAWYG